MLQLQRLITTSLLLYYFWDIVTFPLLGCIGQSQRTNHLMVSASPPQPCTVLTLDAFQMLTSGQQKVTCAVRQKQDVQLQTSLYLAHSRCCALYGIYGCSKSNKSKMYFPQNLQPCCPNSLNLKYLDTISTRMEVPKSPYVCEISTGRKRICLTVEQLEACVNGMLPEISQSWCRNLCRADDYDCIFSKLTCTCQREKRGYGHLKNLNNSEVSFLTPCSKIKRAPPKFPNNLMRPQKANESIVSVTGTSMPDISTDNAGPNPECLFNLC